MGDEQNMRRIFRFDGAGQGRPVTPEDVAARGPDGGWYWVHASRDATGLADWLHRDLGLPRPIIAALVAEETRPRCTAMGAGVLLILRGVNLNPGADPEDMVSLRLWIEKDRVISIRLRRLLAVAALTEEIEAGLLVRSPLDLIALLSDGLVDRMGPVLDGIDDRLDELEDRIIEDQGSDLRGELSHLRRQAIILRRYIAPQREALMQLLTYGSTNGTLVTEEGVRDRIRETADKVTRYTEDLDAARERAAVVHEELGNRLSERMNRNMYVLSLVAGLFLPLGFLTGLLGINVGGVPGVETPWAFTAVVVAMVVAGIVEIWLFKRLKWL
ncbi:zinc transporter ZntB [Oceanibacterium hippocampi]|uniref:Zinc transport protein ZntB n=1 Tax=Oceanibacterium hippocampi TaxID=745714 RepID=A0A1Y5SLY5_9PROT|nr:zinc transporter ZntB [Oceanibacterium hippocampi]SLN43660.1 Zinc transport protein ZntB [Oceanibacterium hippocampi]